MARQSKQAFNTFLLVLDFRLLSLLRLNLQDYSPL